MLKWSLKKLFGSRSARKIKQLWPIVEKINTIEEEYQKLSDDQLKAKTDEFRARIEKGETVDDLLPEAFATVKNACRRMCGTKVMVTGTEIEWDMIPYDVQLLGGMQLHMGGISETQTGEGKTLVAIMPLYLNALTGRNVQLVTVNDYLALRDSEWVGSVLRWLGLTVGCLQNNQMPNQRKELYSLDVTYGTNSEFGFDYLRDMGMANDAEHLVQRDYYFVIIDEIDSILIDEARTPLIISGPVDVSTHRYDKLQPVVEKLFRKQNELCTGMIKKAKEILDDDSVSDEQYNDALYDVMRVKMGMPKHKQLIRLFENPTIVRQVEKLETQIHSDQNRGMFQDTKDTLYFTIDEKNNEADLSELGRKFINPENPDAFVIPDLATSFADIENIVNLDDAERQKKRDEVQSLFDEQSENIHNLSQLLRAYCLYEKDVQYVVQEGKVMIVDEFTGRLMPGRRFGDGLHQALEAKEHVTIEQETQTLATITIQNYFRMYEKLAGMTGTAETEASEFDDIYKLDVLVIPTNRPCQRIDYDDRIFKTKREKYIAVIEEIKERNEAGQPVLVGTISVDDSEILSRLLKREKVIHNVLNAKNHEFEAEIVARAGQRGAVTIATNMAGRGTDIRLGEGVADLGGLHVIGSARHDSRRIDRQLRGRCSRQGDPGSAIFYISLEDDLMRLFGSDKIAKLMERVGFQEGEELSHPLLNRSIENAQRKVEQEHFSQRKRTLQYDDVMNKQREVIYERRGHVLKTDNPRETLFDYVYTTIAAQIELNQPQLKSAEEPLDKDKMMAWLHATFPIGLHDDVLDVEKGFDIDQLAEKITARVDDVYKLKEAEVEEEASRWVERHIMLEAIDELWKNHLYDMDNLRKEIYLRSFAQRDPLVEYKQEAFNKFTRLVDEINLEVCSKLFRVQVVTGNQLQQLQSQLNELPDDISEVHDVFGQFGGAGAPPPGMPQPGGEDEIELNSSGIPKGQTIQRDQPKVKPNDPCPCGSGKKAKKCCLR